MELDTIIETLGGEGAVAADLGCGPSAISNWKTRGIPKARWVDLIRVGATKIPPVVLTIGDLAAAHQRILDAQREQAA